MIDYKKLAKGIVKGLEFINADEIYTQEQLLPAERTKHRLEYTMGDLFWYNNFERDDEDEWEDLEKLDTNELLNALSKTDLGVKSVGITEDNTVIIKL